MTGYGLKTYNIKTPRRGTVVGRAGKLAWGEISNSAGAFCSPSRKVCVLLISLLVAVQFILVVYSFMYQRSVLVLSNLLKDKFDPEETRKFLTPYSIHLMGWFVNFFGLFVAYVTWRETTWYFALIALVVPFFIAARWSVPYLFFFQQIIQNLINREAKLSIVSNYRDKVYAMGLIQTLQERLTKTSNL